MSKKYCEYLVQRLANNRKDQKIKELRYENQQLQSHLNNLNNYYDCLEQDKIPPTKEELHLRELVDKGADYITINHYMRGYDLLIKRDNGIIYCVNKEGKDEKHEPANN